MPTTINYEKADTRILVHLKDALENSSTTCLVRTVDKDVVLFSFHHLLSLSPTQMYEHLLAHGKAFLLQYHQCNIPCSRKRQIVGFTHVPQLQRMWYSVCILRQRQTTRMASLEIFFWSNRGICLLVTTSLHSAGLQKDKFKLIERFTVVLYEKTSQSNYVNSAREDIFSHKARAMD